MNSYWSAISLAIALAYPISPLAISQFVHQADAPINNNSSRKTERSFRPKTLTSKVLYGSSPETIEDLRHLKSLGIKTIINVDGQTPRTDLTRGLAITYLHLPIGYGRIDVRRAKDLAKATHTSSGKVYIHCNLGKHRAPAAAIVACVGDGSIENRQVEQLLRQIFPNHRQSRRNVSIFQRSLITILNSTRKQRSPPPNDTCWTFHEPPNAYSHSLTQQPWQKEQSYPNWLRKPL